MLAILCAKAARQRRLDLAGIYTAAYLTAHIGGIFRDPRLGALPPLGLSDPRFFALSIAAAGVAVAGGLMSGPAVVTRWLTASICIAIQFLLLGYGWNPYFSREPNP